MSPPSQMDARPESLMGEGASDIHELATGGFVLETYCVRS